MHIGYIQIPRSTAGDRVSLMRICTPHRYHIIAKLPTLSRICPSCYTSSWSMSNGMVLGVASRRGVVVRNFGVKYRVPR